MKTVFADPGYWIALFYPRDQWHESASRLFTVVEAERVRTFTSEMVLIEFVDFFSRFNSSIRREVVDTVNQIRRHPNTTVIPANTELFDRALELFVDRLDKQWSLTDCSSFLLMTELEITDALAHDKHFEQAGFRALLRNEPD
jgi:uncharacterized protein